MAKNDVNDMYLAAALIAYGGKLLKIDRSDSNRQRFIFAQDNFVVWHVANGEVVKKHATLEEVIVMHLGKTLCYPPTYPSTLREVKSVIHQGQ